MTSVDTTGSDICDVERRLDSLGGSSDGTPEA